MKYFFDLPEELLYLILDYIPHETLSTLINVPSLHTLILNYLYPICVIADQQHYHHTNNNNNGFLFTKNAKVFKRVEEFSRFQNEHNYLPKRLIIYDCNNADSHQLSQLSYCPPIELHGASNRSLLSNTKVFRLVVSEPCPMNNIPRHVKELKISQTLLRLVTKDVYKLEIEKFDLNLVLNIHLELCDLTIFEFIPYPDVKFPRNLTRLTMVEGPLSMAEIDLRCVPLKMFKYKGNLNVNRLARFVDLKLPSDIDTISLNCVNLGDLKGVLELRSLTVLEIIDCPKLMSFFNSKFPSSLKKMIYKFESIIPNLTFFQTQLINSFDDSCLCMETNGAVFLRIDEHFQLPENLKVFVLDNIPYVKISRLLNLPNLNELVVKRIPGFVNNRVHIDFPSTLYRLTLNNVMLESIEGVKFPKKLTYLDLARNQLTEIQRNTNLKSLQYLQELNLLRNRFDKFDLASKVPSCLKVLSLQSNLIDQFELDQDIELWRLNLMLIKDVRYNSEVKFPSKLRHLQMSIQVNKLSDNFQLPLTLQTLLVHHPYYGKILTTAQFFNKIQYLRLTQLTLLNVIFAKDCQIQIPTSIEKLDISANFNQTIINNFNISHCHNLTHCSLTGGAVKHFNLNALSNSSMYHLELKNMKLKYVSGDFNSFKKLKILNLEQNQIISILNLPSSINELILNKNELNDLSNINDLENCRYLSKIYLEMNPNLDSRVIFKVAKLLMKILENFVGIYLSLNLIFSSNIFLENYDVYGKIIVNTDFIR
ncbi:hypothetical protein Cantr_00844 [Candida viswanathii]|uniref:Uncharacterized protein n=1 Tax=Candida viswanathii TaxID=5486 RepID=A0A367YGJ6_9ASCO|nr:hypothetical protein Cantr_00844 [Candida viswanathii]